MKKTGTCKANGRLKIDGNEDNERKYDERCGKRKEGKKKWELVCIGCRHLFTPESID
jgi:hypothetical protein